MNLRAPVFRRLIITCTTVAAILDSGVAIPAAPGGPTVRDLSIVGPDIAIHHSGRQPVEPKPEYFGREIAAGDFNGDGRTDLAVSCDSDAAPGDRATARGRVFVYFGRGDGFPASIDDAERHADCWISGEDYFEWFGSELAVGDFDGDGLDDIAVSAIGLSDVYRGRVYLITGGLISSLPEVRTDQGIYLSRILGRPGNNAGHYQFFGFSLAAADFNGDGLDDLAVGAFDADGPADSREGCGEVSVFLGRSGWPREIVASASVADMVVYGATKNLRLGTELAAGDVNGDGRAELVIAAWASAGPNGDRPMAGEVTLLDFRAPGAVKMPRRAGRKPRTWDLALRAPTGTIFGPEGNARIGSSASDGGGRGLALGDFDGDGVGDLLIGVPFALPRGTNTKDAGAAYVVWGGESFSRGARIDLADAGSAAALLARGVAGDSLGDAVRFADLNGDGRSDAVLGAPDWDDARGYAAVFLGRPRPGGNGPIASAADALILGERVKWRAGDDVLVLDASFAGRTVVALGAPYGGFVNVQNPIPGFAGYVDMVDASNLFER